MSEIEKNGLEHIQSIYDERTARELSENVWTTLSKSSSIEAYLRTDLATSNYQTEPKLEITGTSDLTDQAKKTNESNHEDQTLANYKSMSLIGRERKYIDTDGNGEIDKDELEAYRQKCVKSEGEDSSRAKALKHLLENFDKFRDQPDKGISTKLKSIQRHLTELLDEVFLEALPKITPGGAINQGIQSLLIAELFKKDPAMEARLNQKLKERNIPLEIRAKTWTNSPSQSEYVNGGSLEIRNSHGQTVRYIPLKGAAMY